MAAVRRIFLGNLPFKTTETEILEFLHLPRDAKGTVEIAHVKTRPFRRLGFGFVTVPTEKVEDVLGHNGEVLDGRQVKVALAKESEQKPRKWQQVRGPSAPGATVMHSKPSKGIPQNVLDKLQALRVRLDEKKFQPTEAGAAEATPTAKTTHPPLLVDVGANLNNFRFKGHLEEVVERSLSAGVHKVMVTGTTVENSQMGLLLARTLPGVLYCTAGVHPHNAKGWGPGFGELLEGLLANPGVVAVGETGLDYNRMLSTMDEQMDVFAAQVEIACKVGKPLFVHEREAHTDLVKVLQRFKDHLPLVVVHCFTGTKPEAEKYIELGYYIGLTGFVCKTERGCEVREILKDKAIPLERLVIETDAPFLLPPLPSKDYTGPYPQGRNNEPCTLPLVARCVAEQLGVSVEEVAEKTTANALRIFGL